MINKVMLFGDIEMLIANTYEKPLDFNKYIKPVLEKIYETDDGKKMLEAVEKPQNEILNIYNTIRLLTNVCKAEPDDYIIVPYFKDFIVADDEYDPQPRYNFNEPYFVPQVQFTSQGILNIIKRTGVSELTKISGISFEELNKEFKTLKEDSSTRAKTWNAILNLTDVEWIKNEQIDNSSFRYNQFIYKNKDLMIDKRILKDILGGYKRKITENITNVFELDQSYIHKNSSGKITYEYVDTRYCKGGNTQINDAVRSLGNNKITKLKTVTADKGAFTR